MLHHRLYKLDSKAKLRFWQVEEDEQGSYRTIAGLAEGKAATSEWTLCEPKNVGRSNETSAVEQCTAEVKALYQKKLDKHYVESTETVAAPRKYFEVMLAEEYSKRRLDLFQSEADPLVFTQPKLDGLRGSANKDGIFSRGGNEFEIVRFIVQEDLKNFFEVCPEVILDGELYNHDLRADFEEIVSTIKRGTITEDGLAKARELAQYHIYDCFIPSRPHLTFSERQIFLRTMIEPHGSVFLVHTDEVRSFAEVDEKYEQYLADEYEGEMIRVDTIYHHKRCRFLLKRKEFKEAEFEVEKIEPGKGNWAGAAKRVICRLPDGRPFGSGIRGTRARGREILAEAEQYTVATVRYQRETADGIPRFGVVKNLYKGPRDD